MNRADATTVPIMAPSLALFAMEGVRATLEYARMRLMDRSSLPRGDGHSVILFPGLAAGAETTGPLRDFCEELGYDACDWGRGRNVGPQGDPSEWLDELADEVRSLMQRRGKPTTLIGWSLGGFYAREVAKKAPSLVRQVITLATPFADGAERTNVGWIYRWINGREPVLEAQLAARLRTPSQRSHHLRLQPQRRRRRVAVVPGSTRPGECRKHRGRQQPLRHVLEPGRAGHRGRPTGPAARALVAIQRSRPRRC